MATTIFPATDVIATAAIWQSMAAVINHGTEDPLSAFIDSTQDSTRLQYHGILDSPATSSVGDYETVFSVDVDLGEAWYYEGLLTINDVDNADPGDRLDLRITPASGVNVRGAIYTIQKEPPSIVRPVQIAAEGSAQTVFNLVQSPAVALLDIPIKVWLVIAGDSGGGNILFEIVKGTDTKANNYQAGFSFLIGHRIM